MEAQKTMTDEGRLIRRALLICIQDIQPALDALRAA